MAGFYPAKKNGSYGPPTNKMSGNRIANIVLGLVILSVVISGYAEWVTYRTREDAELLVLELHNMKVGESSAADVQKPSDSHGRFFVKQTPMCNNDFCIIDFNYPKSLLAKLGLASDIRLGVRLQVYRGQLATVIMDLVCYTKGRDYGVYVVDVIRGDSLETEKVPSGFQTCAVTLRGCV